MGALFGLLTSLSITSGEFFSRRVTNEAGPIVAAAAVSLVAAMVTFVVAALTDGTIIARDMALGACAGVCVGLGMTTYLQGLRVSSSAVIGPVVASLSSLIPFGYAAVTTDAPPWLGYVGAFTAVGGLVLVTVGGAAASNVAAGLRLGLISGAGYGTGTSILINVTEEAGRWPLVSLRGMAFVAIVTFAVARRRPLLPPRAFASRSVAAGLFSGSSSVMLLAGLAANPAAASVTASLFPATSVAAGRLFFGDSVSRIQLVGLFVVIAGTIAIVLA